jgi:GntR family transcriptional regulator
MRIHVSPKSDVPLYRQIVTQVQSLIAAGKLRVGSRVPSVRDLAVDLRINPNTVARAYRELDRLGAIETRGANGSYVCAGRRSRDPQLQEREVRSKLTEAVAAAVSMGIGRKRAQEMFEQIADTTFEESRESSGRERPRR